MTATCAIASCDRPKRKRQWCDTHYARWKRTGSVELESPLERLIRYTRPTGFCWEWIGPKSDDGYGAVMWSRKRYRAHRFSYELLVGAIPDDLPLDHLCRNIICVNPDHLEPVTTKVNNQRSYGASGRNGRKTHCKRGHEFDAASTYVSPQGWRYCRVCDAEKHRNQRREMAA